MNTNQVKSFAKSARLSVLQSVSNRLTFWNVQPDGSYGQAPKAVPGGYIYNGNTYDDATVPQKWNRLVERVTNKQSYIDLQEEASYTWFNRLMVIKIMEENGYLQPTLALVDGTHTPHILQNARLGMHNLKNAADIQRLNDHIANSDDEKALHVLLIHLFNTQPVLQVIFGNVASYMDLLLPTNLLAADGFLSMLHSDEDITTEMYQEVELIGWLYQFYISDKKDEVFKGFKKNKKARAEDIPAATQIFTPKWIVKYMVENTVGKIYLDYEQDSDLKDKMKYLVTSNAEGEGEKKSTSSETIHTDSYRYAIQNLEDLTLLDPASGSGHILVVGFELLMDMYREQGYTKKKAIKLILEHNLYGLDIDDRAMQLARLAILLKAASYDDSILQDDIPIPHIYAFPQAHTFSKAEISDFLQSRDEALLTEVMDALQLIAQGKNLGSTMQLSISDAALDSLTVNATKWEEDHKYGRLDAFKGLFWERLSSYLPILYVLTQQYAAVVANPPYMGQKSMNADLKTYVNKKYPSTKSDLMTIFMEVIPNLTKDGCKFSLINLPSWMFLSSFEKLRKQYISDFSFDNLLHMGRGIFGIDFGSVAFTVTKAYTSDAHGEYFRLHERNFQHIYFEDIEQLFLNANGNQAYLYDFKSYRDEDGTNKIPTYTMDGGKQIFYPNIPQTNFSKIPGSPVAYWVSDRVIRKFQTAKKLKELAPPRVGLQTGENILFIRNWTEISFDKVGFGLDRDTAKTSNYKWFPYNNGGGFRKWYGNNFDVVDWKNDGYRIKQNKLHKLSIGKCLPSNSKPKNMQFYFKESITWSFVASTSFGVRYSSKGKIFDIAGSSVFANSDIIYYLTALLNTKLTHIFLGALNPTLNFQAGNISKIPTLYSLNRQSDINTLVKSCISISKADWDSRETSWGFKISPLLVSKSNLILKESVEEWIRKVNLDFLLLHQNEEELNSIFLDIYELTEEISSIVRLVDITILQEELDLSELENLENDIRKTNKNIELPINKSILMSQFISYCVGLMLGRYRLDRPGLNIAHPDPSPDELSSYEYNGVTVDIDDDAIIPLMGTDCSFQDDILVRLDNILTAIWGKDTLTENKNFLQECLEMPLHKYVTEKFWPYHYKTMYMKKPIYWLFTSDPKKPQKATFKVLVYMHRMDRFTLSKIRNQYLHPHQEHLQSQYDSLQARVETLAKDEAKRLDLLGKQIIECRDFDDRLKALANQQITFDLDDGVTENYKLFAGVVGELK